MDDTTLPAAGIALNGADNVLHFATAPLGAEGNRLTATVSLPEKSMAISNALAAWISAGDGLTPIQATGGWLKSP